MFVRTMHFFGPKRLDLPTTLLFGCFVSYLMLFVHDLSPYLLNPRYTTDDALQQSFPFFKLLKQGIFEGDLVTLSMESYFAPLHRLVVSAGVLATSSPILAGHWVMLLQLSLTLFFLFKAARASAGVLGAWASVIWFLHTRNLVQAMTGGLSRGWAAPVAAAFLFAAISNSSRLVLLVIVCGMMLHPPSAFVAGIAWAMQLTWQLFRDKDNRQARQDLVESFCVLPVVLGIALWVVHRPEFIGEMVGPDRAYSDPAFSRNGGRFPFLPLESVWQEFVHYGMRPFVTSLFYPGYFIQHVAPFLLIAFFSLVVIHGLLKGRSMLPRSLIFYGVAVWVAYFLSRLMVFKLYVPDRYLQAPFGLFTMLSIVSVISALSGKKARTDLTRKSVFVLVVGIFALSWFSYVLLFPADLNRFKTNQADGRFVIEGLSRDGWLSDNAVVTASSVIPFGTTIKLSFDAWRPPAAGNARVAFYGCQQSLGEKEVKQGLSEYSFILPIGCKRLRLQVLNGFKSPGPDKRNLGVKLKSCRLSSPLGLPLVWDMQIMGLCLALIALLLLLSGFITLKGEYHQLCLLTLLGVFIYAGSGHGLWGVANFNVPVDRKGQLFSWVREHTDRSALIAGHPTHIDDVQLIGERKAFITSETAHPFYDSYFEEVKRRVFLTWQAYWANSTEEFTSLLKPEGIDYFVFRREDFSTKGRRVFNYDLPYRDRVKKLAKHGGKFFDELISSYERGDATAIVFSDDRSVVVDVNQLP